LIDSNSPKMLWSCKGLDYGVTGAYRISQSAYSVSVTLVRCDGRFQTPWASWTST